ncbi:MAG: VCBS repeat-containing protein [Flavobacteriaceae bacterium]
MRKIGYLLFFVSTISFSQIKYTDVATDLNLNFGYGSGTFGGGVSFVDFNNDGWDDLTIATDTNSAIRFFQNNNGSFTEVFFGMNDITNETKQVLWIDFDNDGDKDFFTTSEEGVSKLFENDGSMGFTDITMSAGITFTETSTWGASWGDYDNDGDLDLYICFLKVGNTRPNILYRNNGDKTFTDVSIAAGLNQVTDASFCNAFFDYNNDGWQDIFVTNHKFEVSYLYENNKDGTFTDVSAASGANVITDGMSSTVGDYNDDGWFDYYITNAPVGNYLLKNDNGVFSNVAASSGTDFLNVSWGAVFLDFDNDAKLDLYVSGLFDGTDNLLPSALYQNQGNETFTIPQNIGLDGDTRKSFGNAIGDINNDGLVDIFVNNEDADNFLWKNETVNTNNWLKIKLEGVISNRDGVGNRIEINAGGKSQYRYTLAGEGYLGQNSNYEFVGIESATNIDYIKVTWNKTGTVETITNIQPNQAITIKEGSGVVLSTSSEELKSFSVYPNPSDDGVFYLSILNNEVHQIVVTDLSGRRVFVKDNITSSDQFDLSNLSSGVYIAKVISGKKSRVVKLILN